MLRKPKSRLSKKLAENKKKKSSSKKLSEGFGPVYNKEGTIAPGFEGLGPEKEKDLGPTKKMPSKKKKLEKKKKIRIEMPKMKRWYV